MARPLWAWAILKIAPPKVPFWVLTFRLGFLPLAAASCAPPAPPGSAVVRFSVPCSVAPFEPTPVAAAVAAVGGGSAA